MPGVDLGAAVRRAADEGLLVKGGGHAMAAGLTVEAARIPELSAFLGETLGPAVAEAVAADTLKVDAVAAPGAVDEPLARTLSDLGPWGAGRPRPVIALEGVALESCVPVGTGDSLKLRVRGLAGPALDVMAFRAAGPLAERLRRGGGEPLHIAVEISHGTFRGVPRAEASLVDVADVAASLRRAA
jgi:single-stranded-DNA-specific exonuclease